jgi:hypothetical protein
MNGLGVSSNAYQLPPLEVAVKAHSNCTSAWRPKRRCIITSRSLHGFVQATPCRCALRVLQVFPSQTSRRSRDKDTLIKAKPYRPKRVRQRLLLTILYCINMDPIATIQTIIYINNEGSYLLQAGHTRDALRVLQRAVHMLKQISQSSCSDTKPFATGPTTVPITLLPTVSGTSSPCHDDCEAVPDCDDDNHSPLYRHCRPLTILFPSATLPLDVNAVESMVHTLSATIVFNLALACHEFGLESGLAAPLARATELYRAVARTSNDDDASSLVWLACLSLNNLGHLHYEQCEYESSSYAIGCMRDLLRHYSCLLDSHFMTDHEVEEIKLNVAYFRSPTAARAA